ncbi:MAG: chiA4 [Fibrobacteres bacterium]|nr:chiA4 [Fibrobacterota bacterium]
MKMKKVVAVMGVCCGMAFSQAKYAGWSTGYHTTWGGQSAANTFFKAYTHVMYFSGSINPPSAGTGKSFTDAIHKGNCKAILCIGGWGAAGSFESSSNTAEKRAAFVTKIMDGMKAGGFDGVDIDWEEEGGGISGNYTLLLKELRTAVNAITPKPLLTIATADNQVASAVAVKDYVDQMNAMSYWTLVGGMAGYMKKFTDKGVPKSVLGVGYGYDTDGEVDVNNPTDVEAKCKFAIDNAYGGIMIWEIARACAACNDNTAKYVDKSAVTAVRPGMEARRAFMQSRTLAVVSNPLTGSRDIRYSVSSTDGNAAVIDLGLYDMAGGLVKTLAKGPSLPGNYSLPLEPAGAAQGDGAYLIKLTTPAGTQAASTVLSH